MLEDMKEQDLENMQKISCDPRVMKYVFIWLENEEQVAGFVRHAIEEAGRESGRMDYWLAIRAPGTRDFAGFVLLEIDPKQPTTAEVGCILRPEYWSCGFSTEVLRTLLSFGFRTLSLHRVYAKCDEMNHGSSHSLEKGGLVYEGTLREHVWLRDHWRSTRYYGMLVEEYLEKYPVPEKPAK